MGSDLRVIEEAKCTFWPHFAGNFFPLLRDLLVYVQYVAHMYGKESLLMDRDRFLDLKKLKNTKIRTLAKQALFEVLQNIQKHMPRVVFYEKSKTGHGFDIEH